MTKANMKARLLATGATFVEESGRYVMSQKKFDKIIEWVSEVGSEENVKVVLKKGTDNIYGLKSKDGKTVFAVVEIVNNTRKTKENVSRETIGTHGHKAKGNNYIVLYKNKTDKEESVIDTMTTCAEIKAFLKTVSKKQLEYLKIYDANKNEVRKSAWVG